MPPQHDPHAGHQLLDAERFGHIVIAPDRQPVDFVLGGVFGGQENDRHLVARAVHALEDLDAVDVREHHVEDHERRGELGDRTQGAPAGRGGLDVESLVAEGHGYELGDVRLVVDHQDPLAGPLALLRRAVLGLFRHLHNHLPSLPALWLFQARLHHLPWRKLRVPPP